MKHYRYSLRNQSKIAKSLGDDYLLLLLESLNKYFGSLENDPEEIGEVDKYGNKTNRTFLFVPSANEKSEIEFQFVLLSKTYDIYNLAYYSAIG